MNRSKALRSGGFAAAACTACCAPPIIVALGLTAGVVATVGLFLGITAAVAVLLLGAGWLIRRRTRPSTTACVPIAEPQPVSLATPHLGTGLTEVSAATVRELPRR